VAITSLDPVNGSRLARGQQVTLTASIHYELHDDHGFVSLVIQDQAGRLLLNDPNPEPVSSRTGEVTLKGTFTVPSDATRIDVFLPLFARPGGSTGSVARATYIVQ
jgi:hypothetical protein